MTLLPGHPADVEVLRERGRARRMVGSTRYAPLYFKKLGGCV